MPSDGFAGAATLARKEATSSSLRFPASPWIQQFAVCIIDSLRATRSSSSRIFLFLSSVKWLNFVIDRATSFAIRYIRTKFFKESRCFFLD